MEKNAQGSKKTDMLLKKRDIISNWFEDNLDKAGKQILVPLTIKIISPGENDQ